MTKTALKCLDLLCRSSYRDSLYKAASGESLEKTAINPLAKMLLWGGIIGSPFAMNKWNQVQQESFLRGQSSSANLLNSIYAAQYGQQGGLGVPQQFRQQMGLTSTA